MSIQSVGDILKNVRGASYRESLDRDEWKAFAKSVRSIRGNACEICKRGHIELHVHHFAYDATKQPWEYGNDDVALLCRGCHQQTHAALQQFRRFVFRKLTPRSFEVLNGALAVGLDHNDPLELAYAIAEMAASPNSVKRFCAAWHETPKVKPEPSPTPAPLPATHRPPTVPETQAVHVGSVELIQRLKEAAK